MYNIKILNKISDILKKKEMLRTKRDIDDYCFFLSINYAGKYDKQKKLLEKNIGKTLYSVNSIQKGDTIEIYGVKTFFDSFQTASDFGSNYVGGFTLGNVVVFSHTDKCFKYASKGLISPHCVMFAWTKKKKETQERGKDLFMVSRDFAAKVKLNTRNMLTEKILWR